MRRLAILGLITLLGSGCTALLGFGDVRFEDDGGTGTDAGMDAQVATDGGSDASTDAGPDFDAGNDDAGDDAGATDAGPDFDAGDTDAGGTDAGGTDAGGLDAGGMDAGGMDAGFDAGVDAGFDAGVDAGFDAGFDAGPPPMCVGADTTFGLAYPPFPIPNDPGAGLPNPRHYTILPETVLDDVTGLEWERMLSPTRRTYADAIAYCDSLVLGACSDWRLPEMNELSTLAATDRMVPTIDTAAFPGTPEDVFWTRTPTPVSGESWIVTTIRSEVNRDLTTTTNLVRCVRDPMGRTDRNVSTNATTVTVTETGLTWERNPSATEVSHAAATSYCAGLSLGGFTDWRLPSRNELVSIVDVTRATPAIDSTVFGYPTAINYWWTSTIDVFTSRPWFLAFRETGYTYSDPISMAGARCVRP